MLKAGLTGNIGSGKSVVASVFSILGIPVFKADEESKKFLKLPEVIEMVTDTFGPEVLEHGIISIKALAAIVFGNKEALVKLNRLMHPLVMDAFNSWIRLYPMSPYVIMEAAILFESGYAGEFDRIIHVSCNEDTALARVMKRDGATEEQVRSRMMQQLKNDDKAGMSDFVIINDGSLQIIPQVLTVHKALLQSCT